MRIRRIGVFTAMIGAAALALSGCSAPTAESGLDEGTSVSVAWNQAFYSYNADTSFGNAAANNNIIYLTKSRFNNYNNEPKLVKDESFGTYEKTSEDPLTIKYTVNEGVKWSDGTPVDAADLLLAWVANSRALDTPDFDPTEFTDPDTGEFTEAFPKDVVYFDSGATPDSRLGLVRDVPKVSDDGRAITMVYSSPYVDWELVMPDFMPAHVVAKNALGSKDNDQAKKDLITAIQDNDTAALAKVSNFWNSGFNFTELPKDKELYLSTGPYVISDFKAEQYITLKANPEYVGDFKPSIEEVTIRFIGDPLAAAQALENGDVDVISPQATSDLVTALDAIDNIKVIKGAEGTYEHVDLQFDQSKSGHFNDPRIREAFMKVIPRQEILDKLIKPIVGDEATLRESQLFVPGAEGYEDSAKNNGSDKYSEVDVEGAKALLAQAGVASPEVCLLYDTENTRRVNEFQLIQASAAQAGFNVTDCGSAEWGGLLGTPGAYDASLFGWQSESLGVTDSLPTFKTGEINNLNFYSNKEVDSIADELSGEFDKDKQQELLKRLDKILWEDFYGVTIFQFPGVTAYSDTLEGVDPSILAPSVFWNVWDWKLTNAD
jgi:peptide/nickel transport system substrate-binding protein